MLYVKIKTVATMALFAVIGVNEIHDGNLGPVYASDPVYVSYAPDFPAYVPTNPTIVHPDIMEKNLPAKVVNIPAPTPRPDISQAIAVDMKALHELTANLDAKELKCLALNVYHEARGEPLAGQLAVANVTLNRVKSKRYPNTVCKVVYQKTCGKKLKYNAAHNNCTAQFTWTWDGANDKPNETDAWNASMMVAARALTGKVKDNVKGAILYHTDKVNPYWAKKMERLVQIDDHIFYK